MKDSFLRFAPILCPRILCIDWLRSIYSPTGFTKLDRRFKCHEPQELVTLEEKMKVLNVAEKNDAAKRIAGLLSRGTSRTREGRSKFNKIYEFKYNLWGHERDMAMTSVSGHLLGYEFEQGYRKWYSCDPVELFNAPVQKICSQDYIPIKQTLEQLAAQSSHLIIWTDCDREGENIGFEVIKVCTAINPRLQIYRAKFSEITSSSITRAITNLGQPDRRQSEAVDVRSELDLRIGAAFTRFQTLRLTKKFSAYLSERLVSYGSCQFPTLGFVVERYKAIQDFVPENFWKIDVAHVKDNIKVNFTWDRYRLFNRLAVLTLFEKCLESPTAVVKSVKSKPKSKWRPIAMDTIEFEKLASRKLKINAKEAMRIAEKLYTSGIISYPRTETNIFPKGLNLSNLVEMQSESNQWGHFATRLMAMGPNPRNGKKSDQAHPPIHPTRFESSLSGNEARIYELITRHFLACCHKDAIGKETTVEIEIAEEKFVAHGLNIIERNYLEVYPYDKWSDKELPSFQEGETFSPTKIDMPEGETSPPNLLTEADLIALMEKHGIGTDATHAEHIETIKSRMYVGVQNDGKFVPGQLGMGLVEGYDAMGFELSKPKLRAGLEKDLQRICDGTKDPSQVLQEQIRMYKRVFVDSVDQVMRLDEAISKYLSSTSSNSNPPPDTNGSVPPSTGRSRTTRNPQTQASRAPRFSSYNSTGTDDNESDDDNSMPPPSGPVRRGRGQRGRVSRSTRSRRPRSGTRSSGRGRGTATTADVEDPFSGDNRNSRVANPNHVSRGRARARSRGGFDNFTNAGRNSTQSSSERRDENEPVLCNCGQPPTVLTVKKEGPNKGRLFYKCDNCNFFKWK